MSALFASLASTIASIADRPLRGGAQTVGDDAIEGRRAVNYPLSRWYLRPMAGAFARRLQHSAVRPWQLTLSGGVCTATAIASLLALPEQRLLAAACILAAWFFDRADGQLARRQGTASRWGAWLDANVDELSDLALHAAFAHTATAQVGQVAWLCYGAFVAGKYLFMYGERVEELVRGDSDCKVRERPQGWFTALYHAPGNADIRAHGAALATACGAWPVELAACAGYYLLRAVARYALVFRKLRREGP